LTTLKRPLITHPESSAATHVAPKQVRKTGITEREVYAPPTGKFSANMGTKFTENLGEVLKSTT